MADERWNHNIHYQRLVLREIPPGAQQALDVGCGEGMLARRLRETVPTVVGIDEDARQIELAHAAGGDVEYVRDDVLTHDFGPDGQFDLVASIATLHHVDAVAGLRRLASLVRPGGRLVVVGLGARDWPRDLPWELAGAVTTRVLKLRHTYWEHSAPVVWPPPLTYAQLRTLAARELPGSRFRRLVLWRYLLVWAAPSSSPR